MEQMRLKIIELLNYYIKKNKFPDKEYVFSLIEIIVKCRKLEDYVDPARTVFLDKSGDTIADYSYHRERKNIEIFWGRIERALSVIKISKDFDFSSTEILLNSLFYLGEVIYHEIEHAEQIKKIGTDDDSFETILLTISILLLSIGACEEQPIGWWNAIREKFRTMRAEFLYNHFHDLAPEERLAEIKSLEVSLDILQDLGIDERFEFRSFYNYKCCRLLFESLRAYKVQLAPTMYYFKKQRLLTDEMIPFISRGEFTMEERIRFGLSIPESEFVQRWHKRDELKETFVRK